MDRTNEQYRKRTEMAILLNGTPTNQRRRFSTLKNIAGATAAVILAAMGAKAFFDLEYGSHPNTWNSDAFQRYSGEKPPLREEHFIPNVVIVDGGDPLRKTVDVNNFPSTYNGRGEPITPLGIIKVGEEIQNVYVVNGKQLYSPNDGKWIAFPCSNANIVDKDGNKIDDQKTMCIIPFQFAKKTEPPTQG